MYLRVPRIHILATLVAFSGIARAAAEEIAPKLDLPAVLVEITWIANARELTEIRKRYESRLQRSSAGSSAFRNRPNDGIKSFSVLGKRDGNWVCLIFAERPTRVNDAHTLQLGHELGHCLFGDYHAFL